MIRVGKTILSLSIALLLCFGTLTLAAKPDGKGKPPNGNQPVDATASFDSGDIISNGLLQGELLDNGDWDTLDGQLADGETIAVSGDAGKALQALGSAVLPGQGVSQPGGVVIFDELSGASWTIRLDRDMQPANRVQFKMRWVNGDGFEHHLRIGWVVQAYEDEIYPLGDGDYGESSTSSLESATVTFNTDLFRIDGDVEVPGRGKKTKTELEVFSQYGEVYNAGVAPWCGMDGMATDLTCRESTTIQTDLAN